MNPTDGTSAIRVNRSQTRTKGDRSIGAWKCGLPSDGKIVIGRFYNSAIHRASSISLWPDQGNAHFEPELAFVLKSDLPARKRRYSESEIDAAIGQTHLALELIDRRDPEPKNGASGMHAEGPENLGLFIGPAVDNAIARSAREIGLSLDYLGESHARHGRHPTGLPREQLYWLVEHLRRNGEGLHAGQAVITGSYAGVLELPLGADIVIRYAGLGEMTVKFEST